jgi:hypothetical protein
MDGGRKPQNETSEIDQLQNKTISDIGAGFGWFQPVAQRFQLELSNLVICQKIDESTMGS